MFIYNFTQISFFGLTLYRFLYQKGMKYFLAIVLCICCVLAVPAQTMRYVYDTYVNPDTINLVTMIGEKTFLDIRGDRSVFSGENQIKKDSLMANFKLPESETEENKKKKKKKDQNAMLFPPKTGDTFFSYYIFKNLQTQEVQYMEPVFNQEIYYTEDRKPEWKIYDETFRIDNFDTQKAETVFGGRVWTAWFTKSIPVSDGPYKFSGLPGLIVKLEDSKGDYRFELEKILNLPDSFEKSVSPNAKKSTRINYKGDKAAVELVLSKEFQKENRNSGEQRGPGGPPGGGGGHGGMGGGMPPGNGGGMPPGGEMPESGDFQSAQNSGNSFPENKANQNPIELKP